MAHPEAALIAATGDARPARACAWQKLETTAADQATAADLSEMEPEMETNGPPPRLKSGTQPDSIHRTRRSRWVWL